MLYMIENKFTANKELYKNANTKPPTVLFTQSRISNEAPHVLNIVLLTFEFVSRFRSGNACWAHPRRSGRHRALLPGTAANDCSARQTFSTSIISSASKNRPNRKRRRQIDGKPPTNPFWRKFDTRRACKTFIYASLGLE